MNWPEFPVRLLPDNTLRKQKTLNFVRMGNRERHLEVESPGLSPFPAFHFMPLDLLAPAHRDVVAKKAHLFRAVRDESLFLTER